MTILCLQPGAVELIQNLNSKQTSAEEYAQDVISNYRANSQLNAVSYFNTQRLLDAATQSDKARNAGHSGSALGVPIIIKDNINTTSYPTTAGTTALLDHQTRTSAGVVSDLEAQGGIVGAKAGMHELAFGITSNNAVTGAVCNPHDPTKIAGGSSGGTASAVAAGIFPVGLGSDTGGSCRIPAALCGVVGFRPTTDSYAADGIVPICHTRDTAGPLARSVEDIVLVDRVLRRKYSKPIQLVTMPDLTLGVPKELFYENLENEVEQSIYSTLNRLEQAGAKLVEVSFSRAWEYLDEISFIIAAYEVIPDLTAYLEQHAPGISVEQVIDNIGSPDVGGILRSHSSADAIAEDTYKAVMGIHRPAMQAHYERVFREHNLSAIVFPTTSVRARAIGLDDEIELNGESAPTFSTYIRNTEPGSVLGVPGISLPCPDVSGLPIGIEFDGLAGGDCALLALASAVEKELFRTK